MTFGKLIGDIKRWAHTPERRKVFIDIIVTDNGLPCDNDNDVWCRNDHLFEVIFDKDVLEKAFIKAKRDFEVEYEADAVDYFERC